MAPRISPDGNLKRKVSDGQSDKAIFMGSGMFVVTIQSEADRFFGFRLPFVLI
jgi:hypothetical protein